MLLRQPFAVDNMLILKACFLAESIASRLTELLLLIFTSKAECREISMG